MTSCTLAWTPNNDPRQADTAFVQMDFWNRCLPYWKLKTCHSCCFAGIRHSMPSLTARRRREPSACTCHQQRPQTLFRELIGDGRKVEERLVRSL